MPILHVGFSKLNGHVPPHRISTCGPWLSISFKNGSKLIAQVVSARRRFDVESSPNSGQSPLPKQCLNMCPGIGKDRILDLRSQNFIFVIVGGRRSLQTLYKPLSVTGEEHPSRYTQTFRDERTTPECLKAPRRSQIPGRNIRPRFPSRSFPSTDSCTRDLASSSACILFSAKDLKVYAIYAAPGGLQAVPETPIVTNGIILILCEFDCLDT